MKALLVDKYGPPQAARIGEIDKPPLEDGSLLVKIHAAGINPFDYKLITGVVKDFMPISFPHVPGMDGAGDSTSSRARFHVAAVRVFAFIT